MEVFDSAESAIKWMFSKLAKTRTKSTYD